MAQVITLARPYARAAFETARAAHALGEWSGYLAFAAAVASDPQVAALADDPRVTPEQLVALHLPPGVDADSPFARLLHELASRHRLALLPEVAALFETYRREAEAKLLVKVTSAMPLTEEQAASLRQALKRRYGRDIELACEVDPELMGGVVIDTGHEVIDGSARGRLERLAGALMH